MSGNELYIAKSDARVTALEPLREQVRIVQALAPQITGRYAITLQGKSYVQVAGATLLANAMGYSVREVSVERKEFGGGLFGWEATCEILDLETGTIIGRGSGIVTDDENPWGKRPQFARRAMASTRAAGRALRLSLGHLFAYLGDKVQTVTLEEMPEDIK
jgi:hypothetical protein